MRFYTKQHKFYCGIDLHTKKMYVCILDSAGQIHLHKNISTNSDLFLQIIDPFREDIVVAVECIFTWYWIADLCAEHNIPFVPGHALYMKATRDLLRRRNHLMRKRAELYAHIQNTRSQYNLP